MATIEVRKSCSKTSYRAKVRVKGYQQITATFARKTDAKRWAVFYDFTHAQNPDAIKTHFWTKAGTADNKT
ncbi:MAG: hypothetical protein ISP88_13710 [Pseudomonadales bacterium]|nr:hypothetical protein [Pseudomonadales bacterium]MBL6815643.1 hypothetical protein [Pseudomonadales bacterium]